MKAKLLLVFAIVFAVFIAGEVLAAEKDDFWGNLQAKLQKITPTKKAATTTAVGGVRGAKNDPKEDVYWKGKEKSQAVTEEELKKFNLALDTKLKGNNEQALKLFDDFLKSYPQSPLRVEGLQAVEKIKQEMADAKPSVKTTKKTPAKNLEKK